MATAHTPSDDLISHMGNNGTAALIPVTDTANTAIDNLVVERIA